MKLGKFDAAMTLAKLTSRRGMRGAGQSQRPKIVFQKEKLIMADNGEGAGSTGVVAIVAIFVLVILAMLYVFRGKIFSGGGSKTSVNVNISAPANK